MIRVVTAIILLALAGCSSPAPASYGAWPCGAGEASYACQVQRYHDVAAQ